MRLSSLFSASLLTVLVLTGCKKDNEAPDLYYTYYPVTQGRYVTYEVMEVTIDDDLNLNDTSHYFIKAQIGDTITDNEGRIARRYNRYRRASANDPWILHDIWTTIVENGRAELVEENQRTIKLVFPTSKYQEWDGNAYNMLGELDCYYRDLHLPATLNGFSFDSTVTVEQDNYHTSVDYRRKYEQYAKGIGMFYKHYKDFRLDSWDTTNVESGHEIIMKLIDYGVE